VNSLPGWLRPVARAAARSIEVEQAAAPPPNARPSAVLMLFADGAGGGELLLTERAAALRQHAGQIAFPGGRADPEDPGPEITALREAQEEVGLDPATVDVFGQLPTVWIPHSNHAVAPVLGYWRERHGELTPVSAAEVARVLWTPLRDLIDPARRYTVVHPSGARGPAFDVGAPTPLWGFTAGLVARLLDRVGWARPWDETVVRSLPESTT